MENSTTLAGEAVRCLRPAYKTFTAERLVTRPNLAIALNTYWRKEHIRLYARNPRDAHRLKCVPQETGVKLADPHGRRKGTKTVEFRNLSLDNVPYVVHQLYDKYCKSEFVKYGKTIYCCRFASTMIWGFGSERHENAVALWSLKGEYAPTFKSCGDPVQQGKCVHKKIDVHHESNREWAKIVRDKSSYTLTPDIQYNEIVGQEVVKFETLNYDEPQQFIEAPTEPALQRHVDIVLDEVENCKATGPITLGQRMGKTRVGSAMLSPYNAMDAIHGVDKRIKSTREWSDQYDKKNLPYAFLMHKPGSVTSAGIVRNVFPIQPELEGKLRETYACSKLETFKDYVRDIRKIPVKYKYGYDIIGCDKQCVQYIHNYYSRRNPDLLHLILPKVVIDKNRIYRTNQFPSGSPITSVFTNGFTQAVINYLGINAKFNGDGILSETEVDHPMLRSVGERSINNFELGPDGPKYLRYDKINTATYLRGGRKVSGKLRYLLRIRGLSDFGVKDAWEHAVTDTVWQGMDIKTARFMDVINLLHKLGLDIPRKLLPLREFERSYDEYATYGDDAFTMEEVQVDGV